VKMLQGMNIVTLEKGKHWRFTLNKDDKDNSKDTEGLMDGFLLNVSERFRALVILQRYVAFAIYTRKLK